MAEEDFLTNIARVIASELMFSLTMQAAREFYGKSYFSLGTIEKATLDQLVLSAVATNYQAVTPENLKKQSAQGQAGFQVPPTPTT